VGPILSFFINKNEIFSATNGLTNSVEPELYASATVSFVDIVSFTNLSSASTPFQIVQLLNEMFSSFDAIVAVGETGVPTSTKLELSKLMCFASMTF